jgi:hypothetical protein
MHAAAAFHARGRATLYPRALVQGLTAALDESRTFVAERQLDVHADVSSRQLLQRT